MRDTLTYHLSRRDHHQREADKWQALLVQATSNDTTQKASSPEPAPIKANGASGKTHPGKQPQSKAKYVENAIVGSGILGVTAIEIRKRAKAEGVHVATNFPYRQASRMIENGKVWKDEAGRYFHTSFVPVPEISSSAQETSH
jgi:hypothetical protein